MGILICSLGANIVSPFKNLDTRKSCVLSCIYVFSVTKKTGIIQTERQTFITEQTV